MSHKQYSNGFAFGLIGGILTGWAFLVIQLSLFILEFFKKYVLKKGPLFQDDPQVTPFHEGLAASLSMMSYLWIVPISIVLVVLIF